jgi:cyclase
MAKNIRIIPRLDIKGPNLVKGIHLEGLRVLGKPEDFARYYYENGADELMYMDIVASLYNRNSLHDIITKTAREIFIPLTVGGGIRTIDDIREVLRAGADRVALNTAAIKNPDIIFKASRVFGSSTIVVSIEAIKQPEGRYLAYTDCGREYTGIEVGEWAKSVEQLGAGEIFLTSVDRDGTGLGYDIGLIKMVSSRVSIPVIAYGGAGKLEDIAAAVRAGADAVSVSSMFHYDFVENRLINQDHFKEEGNIEYRTSGRKFTKVTVSNIAEVKNYMVREGIECRHNLDSQGATAI